MSTAEAALAFVEAERAEMLSDAEKLIVAYREARIDHRRKGGRTSYGVRMKTRAAGVTIEWYKERVAGGRANPRQMRTYLPRGSGARYPMDSFAGATPWEREWIGKLEESFAPIRTRSGLLSNVLKHLRQYLVSMQPHLPEMDTAAEEEAEVASAALPDVVSQT